MNLKEYLCIYDIGVNFTLTFDDFYYYHKGSNENILINLKTGEERHNICDLEHDIPLSTYLRIEKHWRTMEDKINVLNIKYNGKPFYNEILLYKGMDDTNFVWKHIWCAGYKPQIFAIFDNIHNYDWLKKREIKSPII